MTRKYTKRDYDTMFAKNTGNTETHLAVDERIQQEGENAYQEGFAAASGIRPETAETGGRIHHPEDKDAALLEEQVVNTAEEENAGLPIYKCQLINDFYAFP